MNVRTTWFLLGLALALFIYIVAFERRSLNSEAREQRAALLFPDLDPALVTAIEIQNGPATNPPIRLQRADGQWRLAMPAYPAQAASVESLLRAVQALQQHTYITPQELSAQEGWRSIYGFDPPRVSVEIEQGTNHFRLDVGARTLVGNQVYFQRGDDRGIFVAEAPLLDGLPASPDQWRNPMLLPEERLAFDRIVINGPSHVTLELDPATQLWKLTRPLETRADFNAVINLVQELRTTRVTRFVTDNARADLEPFGLQSPKIQLTLARGSNSLFQVQFGNAATNETGQIYARILNYSNVVLVSSAPADMLRQSDTVFRDHTLVSFVPASVRRVEVKSKAVTFAAQKTDTNAWRIVEPFNAPADAQIIDEMLTNLSRLQIIDFHKDVVPDFSGFGLAPPERRYALKTTVTNASGVTNILLGEVDFGKVVGTNDVDKVFARRAEEASVYTVSLGDTLRLPQAAFELRDRQIWNFDPRNVTNITVIQDGRTRKLPRRPNGPWSNDVILNAAVEKIVLDLSQLRAISWVAQGEDKLGLLGFREHPFQIALDAEVAGKQQTFTLHLARTSVARRRYAATTLEDGKPTVFDIPLPLYAEIARVLSIPPETALP